MSLLKEGFEHKLKSFGYPNSLKNVDRSVSYTEHVVVLDWSLCAKIM